MIPKLISALNALAYTGLVFLTSLVFLALFSDYYLIVDSSHHYIFMQSGSHWVEINRPADTEVDLVYRATKRTGKATLGFTLE